MSNQKRLDIIYLRVEHGMSLRQKRDLEQNELPIVSFYHRVGPECAYVLRAIEDSSDHPSIPLAQVAVREVQKPTASASVVPS